MMNRLHPGDSIDEAGNSIASKTSASPNPRRVNFNFGPSSNTRNDRFDDRPLYRLEDTYSRRGNEFRYRRRFTSEEDDNILVSTYIERTRRPDSKFRIKMPYKP